MKQMKNNDTKILKKTQKFIKKMKRNSKILNYDRLFCFQLKSLIDSYLQEMSCFSSIPDVQFNIYINLFLQSNLDFYLQTESKIEKNILRKEICKCLQNGALTRFEQIL